MNGVLRNIARNKGSLVYTSLSVKYSMPEWILELWTETYSLVYYIINPNHVLQGSLALTLDKASLLPGEIPVFIQRVPDCNVAEGFVNGVLRGLLRKKETLLLPEDNTPASLAAPSGLDKQIRFTPWRSI